MEKVKEDNERDKISWNRIVKEKEINMYERFPAKKRMRNTNIIDILNNRAEGSFKHESSPRLLLSYMLEAKVASSNYKEMVCELPVSVKSTFLMSYTSDGQIVATNHGDHNIYLTQVSTGKLIRKYSGHRMTPWCLKFHPSSNSVFASGCLSGEVRVWNTDGHSRRCFPSNNAVIASLDFHPSKDILAIASGDAVYFWLWKETLAPTKICRTASIFDKLRYVKFHNSGNSFMTGIFNASVNICPARQNIDEVLSDSSDVQILSCSSDTENNSEDEVLSDSSDIQILSCSSDTENNSQDEVLSDSIHVQIVSNSSVTENNPQEEVLHNSSDVQIVSSSSLTENNSQDEVLCDLRNAQIVACSSVTENNSQPFNLTVPDCDPDIQTLGVVLKDGKKKDENADIMCEYKYIYPSMKQRQDETTPLSKGIKRKKVLEQKYVEGASKRQKTVVQTRREVMSFAMRDSREMRILPTGGRFVVSPTIDNNHITVNPFVLNMMRLQSLFYSLNQRLSVFENLSIPPLENLIFPEFNETAEVENNRFGLFLRNLNNVLPSSYQALTYVYRRIQQLNGQFDQLMQCSIMYNYQNSTSSKEITQKVHIILRKVLKKECKISMNSLTRLRIRNEHNLDSISHSSLSTISFEDMTLPIARETEKCNVQRPECSSSSVFLPLSTNSDISSNDCEEVLACESQDASSPLVEDTRSSNIGIEIDHDEAPGPSGLNSVANDDEAPGPSGLTSAADDDSDIEVLDIIDRSNLNGRPSAPIGRRSGQPYSTTESEFKRLYVVPEFQHDTSQALTFRLEYLLSTPRKIPLPGEPQCPPHHRIQTWPFDLDNLPEIHDAGNNVIARECVIHSDASVDISKDGEKLVAIVLDHEYHKLKIAVHSLLPHNLGQLLYIYGPVSNPVTVSISPLSQFIFIGMSAARGVTRIDYPDAEIISIRDGEAKGGRAAYFRTLNQIYHDKDRIPTYSLNGVKWLPQKFAGFSFSTNKGSLVICTPETEEI